jgi:ferredoxin
LLITEDCINCGACADVCPTKAIFEDQDLGRHVVDPDRCTECLGFYERVMCQTECPVECCVPDPKQNESEERLLEKARRICAESRPDVQQGKG